MSSSLRDTALELGYTDARPVTGHPFEVWHDRLRSIPFGKSFSFEHDPAKISGWPVEEITIWVAVSPTPPIEDWPEDCGEISSFYIHSQKRISRFTTWARAAEASGYEIKRDVTLPARAAAIRAGLGVHGLNGLMLTPGYGSYVDITYLLLHAAPPPDARGPENDLSAGCGNCGDCIKACPTGAVSENGVDALVCLRNYMNHPEQLPREDYSKMKKRILGCDNCQRVCPKNAALKREPPPADMIDALKLENLLNQPDIDLMLKYIEPAQLNKTNIKAHAILAAANTGRCDLLAEVEKFIGKDDIVRDKFARWASERLREQ